LKRISGCAGGGALTADLDQLSRPAFELDLALLGPDLDRLVAYGEALQEKGSGNSGCWTRTSLRLESRICAW